MAGLSPESRMARTTVAAAMTKKSTAIIETPGDMPNRFLMMAQTISVPAVVPLNLKTSPRPIPMKMLPTNMKKKKSCSRSA